MSKKKKKVSKKKAKKVDYRARNRKVAANRSDKWRKNVIAAKVGSDATALAKARASKGLSQQAMSEICKFSSVHVYSRLERRKARVDLKEATCVAKKLKVDMKKLFKKTRDNLYEAR